MADEGPPPTFKNRTASDMMSGMDISGELDRSGNLFSEAELQEHFERFKSYDLDDSGFISPQNLFEVMGAMGMMGTLDQVKNMIEEVAILSGHDNDGQLSFRDYLGCLAYEAEKRAVDAEIESRSERAASVAEADRSRRESAGEAAAADEPAAGAADEEEEAPVERMRGSSLAALDMVARGRIMRFEQVITETVKKENMDDATVRKQAKFASKLAKFQQPAVSSVAASSEALYKKSVSDKLSAFEEASRAAKDTVAFKKTWKKVGAGSYRQKTQVAGAPPPKKSFADLP